MTARRPQGMGMKGKWPLLLLVAGAGAVAVHSVIAIVRFALQRALEGDFALYYVFARIGINHGFHALYDLAVQRQESQSLGPVLWYPEILTPPVAWLVAPFALLPFAWANLFWSVFLGLAFVLTWWLTAPGRGLPKAAYLVVALALPPIAFGLLLGQVVIVVAAAVATAAWLMRRGHLFAAGLVLSLIAFKPQLAFLLPLTLLAGGHFRTVFGWLTGSLALLTAALLTTEPQGLLTYGSRLLDAAHSPENFLVPVGVTVSGLLGNGLAAHLVGGIVVAGVIGLVWRHRARGCELAIALGVFGSLLVTPFIHAQDLTILMPVTLLYLGTPAPRVERITVLAGSAAALLVATPLPLLLSVLGFIFEERFQRRTVMVEAA